MSRLFGFLLRLAVVAALVFWLADKPGSAQIVWRDYVIETSAAALIVLAALLVYACVLLHGLWRFAFEGPRFWKLRRAKGRLEDGQRELARGFTALAGGSAAEAGLRAIKARKNLGETPLTLLLQAQAARLAGDAGAARALYEKLTQDPLSAMLGYRGLAAEAWRAGDYDGVAALLARIEDSKLTAPWLHVARFELGARRGDWAFARRSLELARKAKALPRASADRNEAALLLADAKQALRLAQGEASLASAEKARKLAPDWVPAALVLAEAQMVCFHTRAALRTVRKLWERGPHIQCVPVVFWAFREDKPIEAMRFIEKLVKGDPENPVALMARAEAALRCDLWGEARRSLLALERQHCATQKAYQLLARLERRERRDENAAALWLSKAVSAPLDPVWLCQACGAAHETWEASCPSCGAFNRMVWETPGKSHESPQGPNLFLGD